MNNNSKNNTQTKLTLGERISNFFNITTEERKNNISRYIHLSFLMILVGIIVFIGVERLGNKMPEVEETSVAIVEKEENMVEEDTIEETVEESNVTTVEMAVISCTGLNIRKEPSKDSDRIGVLYYGNRIDVVDTNDEDSEWLKMSVGGYVHKDYLEIYDPEKDYSLPEEFLEELRQQEAEKQAQQQTARVSRGAEVPAIVSNNTTAYYTDYVNTSSGLSELDVYNILNEKAPAMACVASDIIAIERDYGINAFFTMAVASHESGWATSSLATYNNNLFGLKNSSTGGWYDFSSKSESVYLFARSISSIYFDRGLVTPWDINPVYCPGDGGFWSSQVVTIMKQLINNHNQRIG